MTSASHSPTELLRAWSNGNIDARDRLISLVYGELRRRASAHLRREPPEQGWQPSDLVNEACLKLLDQRRTVWQNRAHFLAVASELMRRILVDRARTRRASKRSGRWARVSLNGVDLPAEAGIDLLDLDAALTELAVFDARKSRIAELRFFGGLSLDETSHVLQVSSKTVERDWQAARAWLFKRLTTGRQNIDAAGADGR